MSETPKDDTGLKVALDSLAQDVPLKCIHELVIERIALSDIAAGIDPKAQADLDRPEALYQALALRLTDGERKDLRALYNATADKEFWRSISSFYLGYAVALHFTGKIAR